MANTAKKIDPNDAPSTMQVVKNEEPQVVEKPAEPVQKPVLTLEQKMHKVEDLNMLIDKYQKLSEARRNLQSFRLSTDGMSTQVVLKDTSNGTEFKTSNSAVVSVVLTDMIRILEEKICEVERLIEF